MDPEFDESGAFEKGSTCGGDTAGGTVTGGQVAFHDLFETVGGKVTIDGIGGVELFEFDPGWAGHQAAVAMDAFVGDTGLVFGVMKKRDGVERGTQHEDADTGLKRFLEGGTGTVAVLERVVRGEPGGEGAKGDDTGIGVVTAEGPGPGTERFVKNAVVAGGMGDSFVENGDLFGVFVFEEGLEIDVGEEGAGRADGIEKGVDDGVDAAGDGAEGADGSVDHQQVPGGHAEAG